MALYKQSLVSNDVQVAFLCLRRLSAAPDLGIDLRIAVSLSRDVLLDLRACEPGFSEVHDGTDPELLARKLVRCLQRDVRRRGLTAWRSRAALDLLRAGGLA